MEQMINNLGFPIACVVAMGGCIIFVGRYFIEQDKANRNDVNKIFENVRADSKEDREMYRDSINKFSDKLDKFGTALENNNSELGLIKTDIEKIKEKVGV